MFYFCSAYLLQGDVYYQLLSYIVCINDIFCWELFGANTPRLGTHEFKTSVSVYIYICIIIYMTYIQYIYIYTYIYIQYIDMALYMNTIRYMQMDVHWQWSPKRNKKVETCRCGSNQFQTTWLQEIIVFHSTSWTCPARVPSSHPIGLSETLGGTPRNPYLVGGFNPSEKY